jgi:hypothetical protein
MKDGGLQYMVRFQNGTVRVRDPRRLGERLLVRRGFINSKSDAQRVSRRGATILAPGTSQQRALGSQVGSDSKLTANP